MGLLRLRRRLYKLSGQGSRDNLGVENGIDKAGRCGPGHAALAESGFAVGTSRRHRDLNELVDRFDSFSYCSSDIPLSFAVAILLKSDSNDCDTAAAFFPAHRF
jgi:hypothetical protein